MVMGSESAVPCAAMAMAMSSSLDDQALHPRIDQPGPELGEIEDAEHEREQPRDVQENDAARQAREALGDEELPAMLERAGQPFGSQDLPGTDEEGAGCGPGPPDCSTQAVEAIECSRSGCRRKAVRRQDTRACAGINGRGTGVVNICGSIKHVDGFSHACSLAQAALYRMRAAAAPVPDRTPVRADSPRLGYSLNRYPTP